MRGCHTHTHVCKYISIYNICYSKGEVYATVYFVLRFLVISLPLLFLDAIVVVTTLYSEQTLPP